MKTRITTILTLLMTFSITACDTNNNKNIEIAVKEPIEKNSQVSDYKGQTVEAAKKLAELNGVPFRVVTKDGEPLPATMDWRPGRINASTQDGIVIDVQIEGAE